MSSINVSLFNAATGKARLITLSRTMTIADLQALAGSKGVGFTVDGCTPAAVTALGDLYDSCAKNGQLDISYDTSASFGAGCNGCWPCGEEDKGTTVSGGFDAPFGNIQGNVTY